MEVQGHANCLPWLVPRATESEQRVSVLCLEEVLAQLGERVVNTVADCRAARGKSTDELGCCLHRIGGLLVRGLRQVQ